MNKPPLPNLNFSAKKVSAKKKAGTKKPKDDPLFKPYIHNTSILLDTRALKNIQGTSTGIPPIPVPPSSTNFVMRPKAHKNIRLLPTNTTHLEPEPKRQRREEDYQRTISCKTYQDVDLDHFTGKPWIIYNTRLKTLQSMIPIPPNVEMLESLSQEDVDFSVKGFAVVIVIMSFDAENTHANIVTQYEKKKLLPDSSSKFFFPPLVPNTNIQFYLQRNGQTIRVANADKYVGQLLHGSIIGVMLTTIPNTTDCTIDGIIFPQTNISMDLDILPKREIISCSNLKANELDDEQWNAYSEQIVGRVKSACYSALKPILFCQNMFSARPDESSILRVSSLLQNCAAFSNVVIIPGKCAAL